MPDRTVCVHCGTIGFVRREHVITGGRSAINYFGGRCVHTWTILEVGERRRRPRAIERTLADRPEPS
jgi:hypothetical protein